MARARPRHPADIGLGHNPSMAPRGADFGEKSMVSSLKRRLALAFLLSFAALAAHAQATGLLISEYAEGSSNNKAVEIYNGTGAAVDLAAGGCRAR